MATKHRTGYLFKRGDNFYIQWVVDGKKFVRALRDANGGPITSRREAEQARVEFMAPFTVGDEVSALESVGARLAGRKTELGRLDDERNPPMKLSEVWRAYQAAPDRPDSGPETFAAYESHFNMFRAWLAETHPEANTLQAAFTSAIAGEYAAHLQARGLSGNRFNKHVRFLDLLARVLSGPARLSGNPWGGAAIRRKLTVPNSRRELTVEEIRAVCGSASGEMRLLFALGVYSGLRLGDCATLRWGEVDLRRGTIRRIPNKTARRNPRPVHIPLHPVLRDMLAEAPRRGDYVLPETAAQYLTHRPELTRTIQRHFKACGIQTQRPGTGLLIAAGEDGKPVEVHSGKRAVVEVGFHSLRHSFVSLCREAGAPLAVVEAIVGHSNPAMTRHYTHTSEAAASAAVATLPALLGEVAGISEPVAALPPARMVAAEAVATLAEKLSAKNWKAVKSELRALAKGTTAIEAKGE